MVMNREAFEAECHNPKCRVRIYDAGSGDKHERKPLPCPSCGIVGKKHYLEG